MNLLDYSPEDLKRPILARTILLRVEMWAGRFWAEARAEGKISGPFGAARWAEVLGTIHWLRTGFPPSQKERKAAKCK